MIGISYLGWSFDFTAFLVLLYLALGVISPRDANDDVNDNTMCTALFLQ